MPTFLHPGVYVREIPGGARSIEGVPTSTTIFVGETERGPLTVTRIDGRKDYERFFGGYRRVIDDAGTPAVQRVLLPYSLDGYFSNGGTSAYVLRMVTDDSVDATDVVPATLGEGGGTRGFLVASSPGVWGNSLEVAVALSTDGDVSRFRIAVFYTPPGASVSVLTEEWDRLSADPADETYVVDVLRRSLYIRWDLNEPPYSDFTTLDNTASGPFPTAASMLGDARSFASGAGGDQEQEVTALATFLNDGLAEVNDAALIVAASSRMLPEAGLSNTDFVNFEDAFVTFVNNRPKLDLFFIGELPSLAAEATPISTARDLADNEVDATTFNGLYYPNLIVPDPVGVGRNPILSIPPAGYVAGIYARTDGRRGVWKAPAGTEALVGGAQGLQFDVLDIHQDVLNPRGVNAIRRIPGAGIVLWGARTRLPSSEYRYIPVRREAIFLRGSIYNGIQWAVFEPNDERLWQSLRNTIGAFMETQFRNGAFFGSTSREAYFVKVDRETTTPDDRAAGIVNIQVGFAPLRPAEFVIVTLQQITART